MLNSEDIRARELRLMAKRYADRGETEKAEKALSWCDAFRDGRPGDSPESAPGRVGSLSNTDESQPEQQWWGS